MAEQDEKYIESFDQNLLRLLHRCRNGWRDLSTEDLEAIRSDSHQEFLVYSKQVKQLKKILIPLLRSHAWHWLRFTEADRIIAEREKKQMVYKKKGGKKELTPEELINSMSKEQLEALVKKYGGD